ncbi:MAG TPA: diaminopimelate epimerase [Stellaceae bacterium]|jgi:diaminopimelate epimerase|nr:diaminopimelate epimerase [Stellaceae bacterium]
MTRVPFRKMHGLGNDFVVLDQRRDPVRIDAAAARALADRHTGIGCDQIILIEPPRRAGAQAYMGIRNADGSEAGACGNATRCVAALLTAETGNGKLRIETVAGLLDAETLADGRVAVDMGEARTGWRDIPLAREMDTDRVGLALGPLAAPVCTSMGNPHATFFVADAEAIDLAGLGPRLEHDALFPERANIGVATIRDPATIRLRVWERGAGLTLACGSGACAALVAAHRRGLTGRRATVMLDGGCLEIEWREDGHVLMTGPAALSFDGAFDRALIGG